MKISIPYSVLIVALVFTTNTKAQNNIDHVLTEIAKNNKTIIANKQFIEAKKVHFKTGLSLKNPSVEFEYLNGSPTNIGSQTDFLILQSFDFPTAYRKKKQVSKLQIAQTNFQLIRDRQDILFEAKQYCIELAYHNKKQEVLDKRLKSTEKLHRDYQKKLDNGDASILEVNKAKLQFISLRSDLQLTKSEINQINQKIIQLNGGNIIDLKGITYPINQDIPGFQTLESAIEKDDPLLKWAEKQQEINQKKIELSKAMALPKIELGYRLQSTLGKKFSGIHFGFTIPLWENKNTVAFQKEQTLFSNVKIEDHKNNHYFETQQLYEKYKNLNIILTEYKQILTTINNTEMLKKALKLGEISSIQYFMEINYFYSSIDKYLGLEKEYYLVIAELYKYRL